LKQFCNRVVEARSDAFSLRLTLFIQLFYGKKNGLF